MKENTLLKTLLFLNPIMTIFGALFFTLHFDFYENLFYLSLLIHIAFVVLAGIDIKKHGIFSYSYLSQLLLVFFIFVFPFIGGMIYLYRIRPRN